MGMLGRAIGAGLEVGARQLEKDYKRGQDLSAKKDLASYEAEIRQKMQDAQNQFTLTRDASQNDFALQRDAQSQDFQRGQTQLQIDAADRRHSEDVQQRRDESSRRAAADQRRHQENMARIDAQIGLMREQAKRAALGPTTIGEDGIIYERTPEGMRPINGPDGKPFKPLAKGDDPKAMADTLEKLVTAGIIDQSTAKATWLARGGKAPSSINDPAKPKAAAAAPAPAQSGMLANKQPADPLQAELSAARAELQQYGLAQRKRDPDGFARAQQRVDELQQQLQDRDAPTQGEIDAASKPYFLQ